MSRLDLYEVSEIQEIISENYTSSSGYIATTKVNQLLSRGWVLLEIYKTCHDEVVARDQQTIHYVLGIDKHTKQANDDYDNGLIPNSPQNE